MNKITFNSLGLKIPNPQKKQDTAIVYCKRFSNEDSIAQQLREAIRYCRTR